MQIQNVAKYMRSVNHVNAEAIENADVVRPEFVWQTDSRPNDCGVFVMRYMEHYMGGQMSRWGVDLQLRVRSKKLSWAS